MILLLLIVNFFASLSCSSSLPHFLFSILLTFITIFHPHEGHMLAVYKVNLKRGPGKCFVSVILLIAGLWGSLYI